MPFIYVLMTRKTKEAYVAMFEYIESQVVALNPESVMSDFETALRNAVRLVYKCSTRVCYFYLCQAVRKNASQIAGFLPTINKKPGNVTDVPQVSSIAFIAKRSGNGGISALQAGRTSAWRRLHFIYWIFQSAVDT